MGDPAAVKVGPGLLYMAPIGTAEPDSPTATLPSAWVEVGYTHEGHVFSTEVSYENVEVAEELDPVLTLATTRTTMVEFQAAQITATNMVAALNGGDMTVGSPYTTVEPPDLGDDSRLMLFWRADDDEEGLLCRKCLQVGNIAIPRRKAPDKAVIPMQFRLELPTSGAKPFKQWFPSALDTDDPHS